MKQIVVDISLAGDVKVDLTGFKGKSCTKVTEQIQIALGGAAKVDKKPEYDLPEIISESVQSRI